MKRIIRDFNLLKEQGYQPLLFLEYSVDGGIYYFNGYFTTKDYKNKTAGISRTLIVRFEDFLRFTKGCLLNIRKLNGYHYRNVPTDLLVPTKNPFIKSVTDIDARKGLLVDYFDIAYNSFTSDLREESEESHYLINPDKIEFFFYSRSITVHLDEAMTTLYLDIMKYIQDAEEKTLKSVKGFRYFKPNTYAEELLEKGNANMIFVPTEFELYEERGIILKDGVTEEMHTYYMDVHMEFLRRFTSTVKGLAEALDAFEVKYTADRLAGEDSNYNGSHGEVLTYEDVVNVQTRVTRYAYTYMLPDGQFLEYEFEDSCADEYAISDLWGASYSVINLDDICDEEDKSYYTKTSLEYEADFNFCRLHKIMVVQPLYVSKIEYKEGLLNIEMYCIVSLGSSGNRFMNVPLHLTDITGVKAYHSHLYYCFSGGELQIPVTWYNKIDRSKTIEDLYDTYFERCMQEPAMYCATPSAGFEEEEEEV